MKRLVMIALLTGLVTFVSCDKDSEMQAVANYPATIDTYVATNYPNASIQEIMFANGKGHEVILSDNTSLIFDEAGNIVETGTTTSTARKVPVEELPAAIREYVATNYPSATILEAEEEEDGTYEVTLDNQVVLAFDSEGNFLALEETETEDEDETMVAVADLPQTIIDYIAANYPDNTIEEAEIEADGTFTIELDNGTELTFDDKGSFLTVEQEEEDEDSDEDEEEDSDNDSEEEIAIEDLPTIIQDYIATNYPDNTIIEAEFEDGEYEVVLDNGFELTFDSEGNFLELEEDDEN